MEWQVCRQKIGAPDADGYRLREECFAFRGGLWFAGGDDEVQMHFREDGFVDGGWGFGGLLDRSRIRR